MSGITFTGLSSGIDTASIVKQLLALRRAPIDRLNAQKTVYQQTQKAYDDLKAKLLALQSAASALDTPSEFGAARATSSLEGLLTATAGPAAPPSSYQVVVSQLASAQKDLSQGYASQVAEVGTGSVTLTVNGQATTVTLAAGASSLTALRDAINDAAAGVRATILNDGSAGTPYRLVLTAADTGTAGAFTADFSGLSGGTAPVMTNIAAAADALLTVDTVPIVSASNTVANVLDGVTLDLLGADPNATVTVTVGRDPEAIADKVQKLVDAYNDLMSWIGTQTAKGALLQGDGLVRDVADRVASLAVSPLSGERGSYSVLAQAGLSQKEDGTLSFDRDAFAAALQEDYPRVQNLFARSAAGEGKAGQWRLLVDDLNGADGGWLKIATDGLSDKLEQIDDTIDRYQRGLDGYQAALEQQFAAMESVIARLKVQSDYLTQWTSQLYKKS